MKKTLRLLILLIFILCANQTRANEDLLGWQEARWGMTEKEIVEAFGLKLKKLPKMIAFKDHYSRYIIQDYELSGKPFTVFFQMDSKTDKLSQILIKHDLDQNRYTDDILFYSLESSLVRKYGPPTLSRDVYTSSYRQWVHPTTTVALSLKFIKNSLNFVSISYFPTKAYDYNKF